MAGVYCDLIVYNTSSLQPIRIECTSIASARKQAATLCRRSGTMRVELLVPRRQPEILKDSPWVRSAQIR